SCSRASLRSKAKRSSWKSCLRGANARSKSWGSSAIRTIPMGSASNSSRGTWAACTACARSFVAWWNSSRAPGGVATLALPLHLAFGIEAQPRRATGRDRRPPHVAIVRRVAELDPDAAAAALRRFGAFAGHELGSAHLQHDRTIGRGGQTHATGRRRRASVLLALPPLSRCTGERHPEQDQPCHTRKRWLVVATMAKRFPWAPCSSRR